MGYVKPDRVFRTPMLSLVLTFHLISVDLPLRPPPPNRWLQEVDVATRLLPISPVSSTFPHCPWRPRTARSRLVVVMREESLRKLRVRGASRISPLVHPMLQASL